MERQPEYTSHSHKQKHTSECVFNRLFQCIIVLWRNKLHFQKFKAILKQSRNSSKFEICFESKIQSNFQAFQVLYEGLSTSNQLLCSKILWAVYGGNVLSHQKCRKILMLILKQVSSNYNQRNFIYYNCFYKSTVRFNTTLERHLWRFFNTITVKFNTILKLSIK